MGITLNMGTRAYIGPDGVPWMVPELASIDQPMLPCEIVLRLTTEKGALAVDEITYRRRPTDPPITPATIAAAPLNRMVELAMGVEVRAAFFGAKLELLRQLGIPEPADMLEATIDALIASSSRASGASESDDVAVARRRVKAQDPAQLRRHIRSRRIRHRRIDGRFLAKVAKVYTDALAERKPPVREVAAKLDPHWNPKLNLVPKTAQRWVRKARDAKLLGDTEPRRKGGELLQHTPAE
jgi:hypothetical protein